MSEELLRLEDVTAASQEGNCEGMPQRVRANPDPGDANRFSGLLKDLSHAARRERSTGVVAGE